MESTGLKMSFWENGPKPGQFYSFPGGTGTGTGTGTSCGPVRHTLPLMREVVENKVEITKQEARELVERCLKVLYYRDARSYNRHEIAIVTEEGVEIIGPLSSETNWDIAHMVSGFE
ncbi:proteasome subunit beta type-4 [Etheostoma cragini]|uniref:proteasome subunit beta type-4 n=1 Tax=Etheostoma cragini TaxID=417921 RepID=UPI00155F51C4|nr:proteasome subunit beta type-4 [Etheostoma cragini]